MNETWDLAELRDHIQHLGEDKDKRFLLDVVNSVDGSVLIFRYHLFTVRDALKGMADDHDPVGRKNFEFIFGSSEQQKDFNHAKLVGEAHTISCIHTTRNIFDIFAQLVNGLVLNSPLRSIFATFTKFTTSFLPLNLRIVLMSFSVQIGSTICPASSTPQSIAG